LNPCRGGAHLQVTGFIHHQHGVRVAQLPDDVITQVITHAIGVPARTSQQVLHPVRRGIPGMLSDRPAVLPGQVSQQPQHERPCPPPGLNPGKAARDPPHQVTEHALPPGRAYAMASGHRKIIESRHNPR
jgi:hypothetical protein